MNLAQVTTLNEEKARDYLESIRWPNGPVCPHCESQSVVKLQGKSTRPGVYKCKNKECRKQFTVTVGTVFERSHIPLRNWVIAFHMMASSKKGVSAHQIHRSVGCTYKSAWFMCHRIRHAMEQGPVDGPKLSGIVEVDETYVGGKPRGGAKGRVGRGTKKAPVVALVQRDGEVRTIAVNRVTASNLSKHVEKYVDPKSRLITDEFRSYTKLGRRFEQHDVIKHKLGQYVQGDVYTNTVEGFFALIKRGVYGTFHHVSKKHLQRYLDEFAFRYNQRKTSDGTRRETALRAVEGKRLTYR
ncbi:MAG TPA: IS1595 family transposase [Pirellulales bacterium]|jgi:transposase-like protein